jgi:large subunit ribosomal protein L23
MNLVAHDIIIRPLITEKSSRLMELNKYSFEVHLSANKIQVRKAIEEIFKVKVTAVHMMNIHPKPKRMGAFIGKTRSWKKAIVSLAPGERIDFFEGASI